MLKLVKQTGQILYRIWFYILVTVPILLFFPILVLFASKERWYPQFFWMARNLWARPILYGMFCWPRITYVEKMNKERCYMLVANHTSMLDIMLMLLVSRNPFVFVGKKELAKIPLFGFFYKRVCIMVDREDTQSRTGVYRRAQKRLQQGSSICIFPEGGVPKEQILLDNFKDGAFKMAIAHKIPVIPITFYDNKNRFSFSLLSGGPGKCRAKVHQFVETKSLNSEDTSILRKAVRETILNELVENA